MSSAVFSGPAGTLSLTEEDKLWAARGLWGEEGGRNFSEEIMAAYLWAVMRKCLMRETVGNYGLVWCQSSRSINPNWLADGPFCRTVGLSEPTADCTTEAIARREKIISTRWEDIPFKFRGAVTRFAQGILLKPYTEATLPADRRRLSNWDSFIGVEAKYPWGVNIKGTWFFQDHPMQAGDVTVARAIGGDTAFPILRLCAAGLVVGAVVWLVLRKE
jgi:hypothetical protein